MAIRFGNRETVEALLKKTKGVPDLFTIEYFYCNVRNPEQSSPFLGRYDRLQVNPIYLAMIYEKTDLVRLFLEKGINPNSSTYQESIMLGVEPDLRGKCFPMLDYTKGHSLLKEAIARKNNEVVKLLLEAGANREDISEGEIAQLLKKDSTRCTIP